MKKPLLFVLLSLLTVTTFAQDKKVAVVTFYISKTIGLDDFGNTAQQAGLLLRNNPDFNLGPILSEFHDAFFNDYSKNFPFQLMPEADVINNPAYKSFSPLGETKDTTSIFADKFNLPYTGYKIVLPLIGHENERNLLAILNSDGVMKVYIDFDLVKIGFGGMGVVKINAHGNIALFNKNGDKVFSIKEDAKSKSLSPLISGVPVMTTEKILPMCESAMEELMVSFTKDLPKMIKKADAKL